MAHREHTRFFDVTMAINILDNVATHLSAFVGTTEVRHSDTVHTFITLVATSLTLKREKSLPKVLTLFKKVIYSVDTNIHLFVSNLYNFLIEIFIEIKGNFYAL